MKKLRKYGIICLGGNVMAEITTILGLDLSSVNSGYAIIVNEELVAFGSIIPSKTMTHCQKLSFIYSHINSLCNLYKIDFMSIEDQHLRSNTDTLKLLSRISGVAMLCAEQHGIGVYLYPATTIKLKFTGRGNAEKKDMIEHAVTTYNLNRGEIDDNIADAIGAAYTHFVKKDEVPTAVKKKKRRPRK